MALKSNPHVAGLKVVELDRDMTTDDGNHARKFEVPDIEQGFSTVEEPTDAYNLIKAANLKTLISMGLSELEANIIIFLRQGYTYKEIEKIAGYKPKTIDNARKRAVKRIRSIANEQGYKID